MASTIAAAGAIVLEVLNQHNYKDWSDRVKTYLLAKDLWDVVEEKPPDAENRVAEYKAWKTKNAKALHAIKISCGTEMFSFIREKYIAKEAWEALEKNFKFRDIVNHKGTGVFDLHQAAMEGNVDEVKRLLPSAIENDLKKKDGISSRTALDTVVVASCAKEHWIQIATDMAIKHREILQIRSWPGKYIPVVRACSRNKWEMASCLYKHTPNEALLSDNGMSGAQVIRMAIWRPDGLDVAWDLIQKHPKLAMADDGLEQQPMLVLAGNRRAFKSGARLTLWQKLIYESIKIKSIGLTIPESRINVSEFEDEPSPKNISEADQRHQRNLLCSVMNFSRRVIMDASKLLGINDVYEMKSNHLLFDKFLSCMVEVIKDLDKFTKEERNVVKTSLFKAVEQGHVEFIEHMLKAKLEIVDIFDDKKRSIFQYAIECRQEKIYNIIYKLEDAKRDDIRHNIAKFRTNMLHSAANLFPVTHFNHIQGASLQMQRELQWFKEVESMLPSEMHEFPNTSNLTARELFTKNHKKLKDEAEIAMKGIAASSTTVGALIVTMMFAVAFTAPGGTNGRRLSKSRNHGPVRIRSQSPPYSDCLQKSTEQINVQVLPVNQSSPVGYIKGVQHAPPTLKVVHPTHSSVVCPGGRVLPA